MRAGGRKMRPGRRKKRRSQVICGHSRQPEPGALAFAPRRAHRLTTPPQVVDLMVKPAGITRGVMAYDLDCGDGCFGMAGRADGHTARREPRSLKGPPPSGAIPRWCRRRFQGRPGGRPHPSGRRTRMFRPARTERTAASSISMAARPTLPAARLGAPSSTQSTRLPAGACSG